MASKVMHVIDPLSSLMECRVCGARHSATIRPRCRYRRGSWQFRDGCKRTLHPSAEDHSAAAERETWDSRE